MHYVLAKFLIAGGRGGGGETRDAETQNWLSYKVA